MALEAPAEGARGTQAGAGERTPASLVDIVELVPVRPSRVASTDVVLPLTDDPRCKLRIRCVVRPDKAQALLLDRLGLRLPERLKPPPPIEL